MPAPTDPTIETERLPSGDGYVAHGPDGHRWLLKRGTAEAAKAAGLAYFLSHYCRDDRGRWVVANIDGTPYQAEV